MTRFIMYYLNIRLAEQPMNDRFKLTDKFKQRHKTKHDQLATALI